jgi:hypothetical protein
MGDCAFPQCLTQGARPPPSRSARSHSDKHNPRATRPPLTLQHTPLPCTPRSQKAEPIPTPSPHVGSATGVDPNPNAGGKRAGDHAEDVEGQAKKQVKRDGTEMSHERDSKGRADTDEDTPPSLKDDMLLVKLVAEERTHPGGEAGTFWSRVLHRWQSDRRGSSIERTALDLKDRWCIITGTGNGKDLPADAMVRCGAASSHPQTYLP